MITWLSQIPAIPRRIYRGTRYRSAALGLFLKTLSRHGTPDVLVAFGAGLGDQLLCTAVLHEFRQRGYRKLWLMSNSPELFDLNPDVDVVVSPNKSFVDLMRRIGRRVISPAYAQHIAAEDRDIPPKRHIIATMCERSAISGEVSLRPYVMLAADERIHGRIAANQIAIQSSGLGARYPMRNKEWYPERFQAVVESLRGEYTFVQLGAASDPPLEDVIDLRGKTTLRQTAAILSQSLAFVGQVGLLMHLARAVDCRSVIIYGGREAPEQSGYSCNENLFSAVPCAPCWKWNTCEYDRMCMREIGVDAVMRALRSQIERHGQPLAIDIDTLP